MTSDVGRKFHIIREIASGGFGSVFLAKVIHADGFSRLVAVKLLHPKWSEDERVASRMRDEARLLGWLRHRNIVEVLDLTRIDGRVAVLMEYLEAVDIRSIIQAHAERGLLVPARVSVEVCAAVASALDAAYNRPPFPGEKPLRVIHRDIKPSNIMLDEAGTVKVLDFGVARADFESRESKTEEIAFGSLEYMPPERLFFEPDTPASDVYSLGCTLYESLALEKFGKAKLRPAEHETYIFDRLERLLTVHPIADPEAGEELLLLLKDMLAFDEGERPTAADAATRMRSLARRFGREPGLNEWCERSIPPLVQRVQAENASETPSPLVDRVLSEDPRGFGAQAEASAGPRPPEGGDTDTDLRDAVPQQDAAWNALKEKTLQGRGPQPPAVSAPPRPASKAATPAPAPGRAAAKYPGFSNDDDDEDPPTNPTEDPATVWDDGPNVDVSNIGMGVDLSAFADAEDEPATTVVQDADDVPLPPPPPPTLPPRRVSATPPPAAPRPGPPLPPPPPPPAPVVSTAKVVSAPPPVREAPQAQQIDAQPPLSAAPIPPPEPVRAPEVKGPPVTERPQNPGPRPSEVRTQPVEAASNEAEPAAEGGGLRGVLILAFAVIVALGLVGVGFTVVGGVVWVGVNQEAAPTAEVSVVAAKPDAPPLKAAPAAPSGPGVRFRSALPGTTKVQVRCGAGEGRGEAEAFVAGETPGDCTVTAFGADRSRVSAVVKAAEPRSYTCFKGGVKACE